MVWTLDLLFVECYCVKKKVNHFQDEHNTNSELLKFHYRQENWKSIKPFGSSPQVLLRLDFRRSLVSGLRPSLGRSVGSLPEQWLVIEPSFAWPGQFLFYFFNLVGRKCVRATRGNENIFARQENLPFQNNQSYQVKSLYLEPLLSSHHL